MKFEELTKEDQTLVNTKFPEALEKDAAAEAEMINELYLTGFDKLAAEAAEAVDEHEKEEKAKEKEEKEKPELKEEHKKEASARGAFIARGYIDGLMKLGEEKHQDPFHYLYPALQEKLAAKGKAMPFEALRGLAKKLHKGVKGQAHKAVSDVKKVVTGKGAKGGAVSGKERVAAGAKTVARAGGLGAAGMLGYHAFKKD